MSHARPAPVPSRIIRSAGAIVWRVRDTALSPSDLKLGVRVSPQDLQVLLVHRPRYDDWSWPKGKSDLDETLPVAGVREVEEETGVPVDLAAPLLTQRYRLGSGQTKEVYYWVGTATEHPGVLRTRLPVTPAPSSEIDESRWVAAEQARSMLTRRGDRRLLTDVIAKAQAGTLRTMTVILARQGSLDASREVPASERQLSRLGVAQSRQFVDMLSSFGVRRALSAPRRACQATLLPYAHTAGLSLPVADELEAGEGEAVMRKLLGTPGSPLVVCAPRRALSGLLKPIREITPHSMMRKVPVKEPFLRSGQLLVAHIGYPDGQAQLIDVSYHRALRGS